MSGGNANGFQAGIGAPTAGFGARGSRYNTKRLSVALPPKVASISENAVENPTPRTSRSHLLAGLRTQPKTPSVPASAPYHQTHHSVQGLHASQWADANYTMPSRAMPQTATAATFDLPMQHAMSAGRQMYSLPEQVLAPPVYEAAEEMDPSVLQQMQLTSMFLAQRQQQLQMQLASLTATAQGMSLNTAVPHAQYQQSPISAPGAQHFYGQQAAVQSPMEVPGQPGVYVVYNPAIQAYTYAYDQNVQQQMLHQQQQQQQRVVSPSQQTQMGAFPQSYEAAAGFGATPPATERSTPVNGRSITPPKKAPSPPSTLEHVQPLPPPSATAFRRGHKKATSLAINPYATAADGPKTSSNATFGSQRSVFPQPPMTGTFGPGAARAGEHPTRQPRGPPPLEELTAAPTSKHEGSKNFAARQRRRALDSLTRAGNVRRGVSRSSGGSPLSDAESYFPLDGEDASAAQGCRKMSPIGSEMQEKRGSHGSADGYFGLISSASSSDEEASMFRPPPTPATPVGERKKMMMGVLNAAEKRKSLAV